MNKLIEFKNVVKRYDVGEKSFNALDGISFSIPKGRVCSYFRTKWCWKINSFKFTWWYGSSY